MQGEAVDSAIAAGDWRALVSWLTRLADAERRERHPEYRSRWSAAARDASATWAYRPRLVRLALALGLSETPEEANRACGWGAGFAWTDEDAAMPHLSRLLLARGETWATAFAALAAATRLRGEAARAATELSALLLPVYARFPAEIPEGAVPRGWAQIVRSAFIASTHPDSPWVPLRLVHLDDQTAEVAYDLPTSLDAVLDATPRLPEMLTAALRTPDALAEFADITGDGWNLAAGVRAQLQKQTLDRETLLDETLAALTRADRAGTQRVMAALLTAADVAGADAAARLPLAAHLMPTVHGSVTAVLLPAVLQSAPDDDVLIDIGTVILTRTEKAQKRVLLRSLASAPATPAVDTLLQIAAADADAALAATAVKIQGRDAAAPPAPAVAPFPELGVKGYTAAPVTHWSPDAAGLDAARSDEAVAARTISNAMALDAAVRFAHRDLPALRAAVRAGGEPHGWWGWTGHCVLPLLQGWCTTGERRRSYAVTRPTYARDADGRWVPTGEETVEIPPPPHQEFTERLVEETLGRLGEMPELVSTPSRADASLTLDDLAARLGRARSVGAYDLVQALLRLAPVDPSAADLFAGVSVPVGDREPRRFAGGLKHWFRTAKPDLDAGKVVADWIRAGGIPAKSVVIAANEVRLDAAALPLPPELASLDGLRDLCGPAAAVNREHSARPRMSLRDPGDVVFYLGVVPQWTDAAAALLEVAGVGDGIDVPRALAALAATPGRTGAGTHRILSRMLSHPRQDGRLLTVDAMTTLATQGRLDADLLCDATLTLLVVGDVSLTRLADAWDTAARMGLVAWIWPSVSAALRHALAQARVPAGTAELIRVVGAVAPTIDDRGDLVEVLRPLATGRSTSKAAHEARAALAALDGTAR